MSTQRRPNTHQNSGLEFTTGICTLGVVLVARSALGLSAIFLGDHPEPLISELRRIYPDQPLVNAPSSLQPHLQRVISFINNPASGLDLPLDLSGTPFQQLVWQELLRIPPAQTRTYSEVARRLASPGAVRAVASACAANRLAVAVPCHRVIRTDGSLAGYRWGIGRKQMLLDLEKHHAAAASIEQRSQQQEGTS